jgi:cytoskeletal protein RodZ
MKTSNGNGQANVATFSTAVIDENPYIQRTTDEQQLRTDVEDEIFDRAEQDEEGLGIDPADEPKKVRQRRRRLALAVVAVLVLVSVVGVLTLYSRGSTRVEYGQRPKQSQVVPPAPSPSAATGRDTRTEQAIEEAQRLTTTTGQAPVEPSTTTDAARSTASNPDTPFNVPTNFAGTVKSKSDPLDPGTKTDSNGFNVRNSETSTPPASGSDAISDTRKVRSQRSSETSFYTTERAEARNQATVTNSVRLNSRPLSARENRRPTVVLPSFGSMLPVRTIGGLYTLRSGALTRLELTRDMRSNGWSMKRGTILVGTNRGGEYDRAYVNIVGFIDPQSASW